MPLQEVERLRSEIGPGVDAVTIHSRCRRGTDTVELANRQALNEFRAHPRRDDEQPIRLAMVRGEFGQGRLPIVGADVQRRIRARCN
jgi:hypothetical protein